MISQGYVSGNPSNPNSRSCNENVMKVLLQVLVSHSDIFSNVNILTTEITKRDVAITARTFIDEGKLNVRKDFKPENFTP